MNFAKNILATIRRKAGLITIYGIGLSIILLQLL